MIGGNEVVETSNPEASSSSNPDDVDDGDGGVVGGGEVGVRMSSSSSLKTPRSSSGGFGPESSSAGISSSLLEVISQLRKRTKSEGDRFLASSTAAVDGAVTARDGDVDDDNDDGTVSYKKARFNSNESAVRMTGVKTVSAAASSSSPRKPASSSSSPSSSSRLVTPRPMLVVDASGASKVVCANCDFCTVNLDEYNRHRCDEAGRRRRQIQQQQRQKHPSQLRKLQQSNYPSDAPAEATNADASSSSSDSRSRSCLSCSREFPSSAALREHKTDEGEDVKCKFTLLLICKQCEFAAGERVDMQEHVYQHHSRDRNISKIMVSRRVYRLRRTKNLLQGGRNYHTLSDLMDVIKCFHHLS